MTTTHRALVFTDLNCPYCYATEERLVAAGVAERVAWCGVQHAPELPVPMRPAVGPLSQELPAEVQSIRQLAPEVEIELPPGKPNTRAAIEHAAAALRRDPGRGRAFVRSLYRAFWVDGTDLSAPAALAALAERAGLPDLQVDAAARDAADTSQAQWHETGLTGVPVVVRNDGRGLIGLRSAEELRAFLA